jgi:ABC-2 type transport system permease protein
MRAYWQLVWAQLLLFFRNRNTIIWSFFLPIFMMVALGTLIGNGGSQITFKMAVVDLDKSSESQRFAAELRRLKGVQTEMLDEGEALRQLKRGDVQMAFVIRHGFQDRLQGKSGNPDLVSVYLDKSNPTMSQIGAMLAGQLVDRLNKERMKAEPLIVPDIVNTQTHPLTYIDFLVPGILALMIMNNNLNGVAGTIASWRERGILRRMQGTPLSSATFIAGQMTARILVNALQAVAVLLVAYFVFHVKVYGSWGTLLFFILLGTLTFMSIGFIIASLAKTPESAAPIAGLISFPMMFVGGIFFPVRSLPGLLKPLVKAIPIGYLTDALRGVMNEGTGLAGLTVPLWVLSAWAVAAFAVAAFTFRWDVRE